MKEIWKPVVGYERYYEVSNLGRVKSLARKAGEGYVGVNHKYNVDRIRKLYYSKRHGRLMVTLDAKGKSINTNVHRLVMKAFNPTNNPNLQINHKDGNKLNNRLDNLEWVTGKENIAHAFRTGLCDHRRGEHLWNSKLTNNQVRMIKNILSLGTFKHHEIGKMFKVTAGCIYHIAAGRNYKHISGGK